MGIRGALLKGSFKGDIDIDIGIEVDVDVDIWAGVQELNIGYVI